MSGHVAFFVFLVFLPLGKCFCHQRVTVNRARAIREAVLRAKAGDIILLCGKGHEKYQLINRKKVPFCERDLLFKYAKEYSKKPRETVVR